MKLLFPEPLLSVLRTQLRANPSATGVELTHAEFVDIMSDLISTQDSNCVLLGNRADRKFSIDGRCVQVEVKP